MATLRNRAKELDRVRKEIGKAVKDKLKQKALILKEKLAQATPVDTGNARAGWKLKQKDATIVIYNDVAYISQLNAGSSQQAPAFFIESTVASMDGLKTKGAIVNYKGDANGD